MEAETPQINRKCHQLWQMASEGEGGNTEKKKMLITGCKARAQVKETWELLNNHPYFFNAQSNNENEVLKNMKMKHPKLSFQDTPGYSQQCSTARLYNPFVKKISSFMSYEQVESVPS